MSDLSISAQAVLSAMGEWFTVDEDERNALADSLRSVADQVVPKEPEYQPGDPPDYEGMMLWHRWDERQLIRSQLLTIADELDRDKGKCSIG